ncbi:protein of unknown function (plasmid) [Cupriavidus taiwanensis]|uniref:Uncharacterized protein n=1 Tax=Cupriavidus taiwanensis TaxID=164546 RepID=A0A7Z7NMW7_9BURK|nr:protein of unknown function [Cupriavidus taiwanensis]SOZ11022.1 protein of unknown function [Cupriavidus taiwanensis]SOZ42347.1 protein of unknown function [Cupriavidus taiwanensis]SPC21384.1 protein of unknown function [Cupriavidus taiwanensis]SPD55525.1 protein of unknown function [Cupriavidus taiwanensis]
MLAPGAGHTIARRGPHHAAPAIFPAFRHEFSNKYPRYLINLPALLRLRARKRKSSLPPPAPQGLARPFKITRRQRG